jgi:16S rRNA pseudouridine516 synthase
MEMAVMGRIRLDKYLANMGLGTRTEVKTAIRKQQIKVNDIVVRTPEIKIDALTDIVTYQGVEVVFEKYEYYMLNKPSGYVSATTDKREKTVIELISSKKKDLFPVGRLDKDTEGLLLVTNDGVFAHNLLSPKKHVRKKYYALVEGRVTEKDIEDFQKGVDIGEKHLTLPASLEILKSDEISEVILSICEGKFHQVKRMFQAVDKKVTYLRRISMGQVTLDEKLDLGSYRRLTAEEVSMLKGELC